MPSAASNQPQSNYSALELAALLMSLVPANRQAHHIGKMLKDMIAQGDLEAALRGERDLTPGQLLALAQLVLAQYKPDNGGSVLTLAAQITLNAHQALEEELIRLQERLAAAESGGSRRGRVTRTAGTSTPPASGTQTRASSRRTAGTGTTPSTNGGGLG